MLNSLKKNILKRLFSRLYSTTWSSYYHISIPQEELRKTYPEIRFSGETPLCTIMNTTNSDKGNGWHNYSKIYFALFTGMKVTNLFELGIGTTNSLYDSNMGEEGTPMASHRGWRTYFDKATIYAADIDAEVAVHEEKIWAYACDQNDTASVQHLWSQPHIPQAFDIMIDDGLHKFNANCHFFDHSIHLLKPQGIYIVEDIKNIKLGYWEQKIKNEYLAAYPELVFRLCCIPNLMNGLDNNLLIIYKLT